jgi:hypothetical protein
LHVPEFAAMNCPLLHEAPPHAVLFEGKTHAPEPLQLVAPQLPPVGLHAAVQQFPVPAMPQTLLVHCAFPVHPVPAPLSWQVVLEQKPLWQSFAFPQPWVVAQSLLCATQVVPPQSTSVSFPSFTPSLQETHVPGPVPKQSLFVQSAFTEQCFRSAHLLLHEPPQSTSVSLPF